MKTSYREIIIKNIPHVEDDENFYNNAIKKINEMIICLDVKKFMDSAMEADLTPTVIEKIKNIIINLYNNYSSENFGKVIRSPSLEQLLEADCLSHNCKKINLILDFYKDLASLIEKEKQEDFLFSFYIARKCLCLKQVQLFYSNLVGIPKNFGPNTEDTICLTKFYINKAHTLIKELNDIKEIFSDIRWEECSENAVNEISTYSKEESDAQFLSSNYLNQIYSDQRFKESEKEIEKLNNGIFNSRKQNKLSELIKAQKVLITKLEKETINSFLANLENQNNKDYWNGIYENWIKTGKINSSAKGNSKTSAEVLSEAVQWYKDNQTPNTEL